MNHRRRSPIWLLPAQAADSLISDDGGKSDARTGRDDRWRLSLRPPRLRQRPWEAIATMPDLRDAAIRKDRYALACGEQTAWIASPVAFVFALSPGAQRGTHQSRGAVVAGAVAASLRRRRRRSPLPAHPHLEFRAQFLLGFYYIATAALANAVSRRRANLSLAGGRHRRALFIAAHFLLPFNTRCRPKHDREFRGFGDRDAEHLFGGVLRGAADRPGQQNANTPL